MKRLTTYWVCVIPLVLFTGYWLTRPFQQRLGEAHSNIAHLKRPAKANIGLACKKLDGCMINPGQTFSFNKVIGPRKQERGYRSAPSYLDKGTGATEGGGICLVSSLVYKAALESDLKILERKPHSRTISTVPPGLDATVWYGRYDLKFQNTTKDPIMLRTKSDGSNVSVVVFGSPKSSPCEIVRSERNSTNSQMAVTVYLKKGDQLETVSNDLYDRQSRN